MKTENIREFDKLGRITIKKELLEFCKIKTNTKIAICTLSENQIMLRGKDNLEEVEIITFIPIDDKGRIAIPLEIRENTTAVKIYVKNGNLILEEAH